jgi:hypothetical protein
MDKHFGGMAERSKANDLKSFVPERVPGVRIPLPPPFFVAESIGA